MVSAPERRRPQRGVFKPFNDYLGPGRRRTDNPLVIATIVLLIGLIALSEIAQLAATVWAGASVRQMIQEQRARDKVVAEVRGGLIESHETQLGVLRRVCFNTAKTAADTKECLALPKPVLAPRPVIP